LGGVGIVLCAGLLPSVWLDQALLPWLFLPIAALLLASWLLLSFIHLSRALQGKYSLATVLILLLIPFFGLIIVSLRKAGPEAGHRPDGVDQADVGS
jgi:hypothetical protein